MNLFEFFGKSEKSIGSFECNSDELYPKVINLLNYMGMTNPASIVTVSSKGISIRKKGNKFVITMHGFTPPLEISWTGKLDESGFKSLLKEISESDKKIAYLNNRSVQGIPVFQAALA